MNPLSALNLSGRARLPLVLQSEASECGYACIAMVCAWFGRSEDTGTLRQRFGSASRGSTVRALLDIATSLGLSGRALRCDIEEVKTLCLPAILHWDFNHYVVLRSVRRNRITLHDPASGVRCIDLGEAGRHFTGVALEFTPSATFEERRSQPVPGLWHYFAGLRGLGSCLARILLLSAILQLVALATPFYMQIVIDEVLAKQDADLLVLVSAGFMGLTLFAALTRALRGWSGVYLTSQLSFMLGTRLMHQLVRLPVNWFQQRHMGDVVSRFQSIRPIREFLTSSAVAVILDGMMATTTLTMLCIYSMPLAMIAIAFLTLGIVARAVFYPLLKRRTLERITADARADSNFMESVRSISTIKRFALESQRCTDWQNRFTDSINASIRVSWLSLLLDLIEYLLTGLGSVAVIYFGARLVLDSQFSIGMLYAFLAYRNHLNDAMRSLGDTLARYLMLSLHLERLADITRTEPEQTLPGNPRPIEGRLDIMAGGFRYGAMQRWIFRGMDLSVESGSSLAIVGSSGAGKSTLLAVMMRLVGLDEGELRLDGHPARAIPTTAFRRQCASVMQDDRLLAGSICSNIALGDDSPDMRRIESAARIALIHDDIMCLPMTYESLVGEMGTTLSAGQVQRILIARALYCRPKILFLDEGTAHLDSATEMEVMKRLLAMSITCIFATHNRAIAKLADKVMSLGEQGCTIRAPKRRVA